jgi:hypothetical protein
VGGFGGLGDVGHGALGQRLDLWSSAYVDRHNKSAKQCRHFAFEAGAARNRDSANNLCANCTQGFAQCCETFCSTRKLRYCTCDSDDLLFEFTAADDPIDCVL